ncbi:MAG: hypothetical protein IT429_20815 [Gemmataceae bacterium]|nr:hypothetical protein [Gemmataceae bacterium]
MATVESKRLTADEFYEWAHRPGKDLYVVDETDELTGEDVLPDLRYRVADFFTLPAEESER